MNSTKRPLRPPAALAGFAPEHSSCRLPLLSINILAARLSPLPHPRILGPRRVILRRHARSTQRQALAIDRALSCTDSRRWPRPAEVLRRAPLCAPYHLLPRAVPRRLQQLRAVLGDPVPRDVPQHERIRVDMDHQCISTYVRVVFAYCEYTYLAFRLVVLFDLM